MEEWCYQQDYQLESLLRGVWRPPNSTEAGAARLQLARTAPCLLLLHLATTATAGLVSWQPKGGFGIYPP